MPEYQSYKFYDEFVEMVKSEGKNPGHFEYCELPVPDLDDILAVDDILVVIVHPNGINRRYNTKLTIVNKEIPDRCLPKGFQIHRRYPTADTAGEKIS